MLHILLQEDTAFFADTAVTQCFYQHLQIS